MLSGAMRRAKLEGSQCDLRIDKMIERVLRGRCEVTGIPFDYCTPNGPWLPSLDRVDNSIGYVWWNVQIVCWAYNRAKSTDHHDVVLRLARALVRLETNQSEPTTNA